MWDSSLGQGGWNIRLSRNFNVWELPPSFLESILGKNLPPSSLPSKKSNFDWDLVHPNTLFREGDDTRDCQQLVSISNPKTVTPSFPYHRVLFKKNPQVPQHMKQLSYSVQLPIVRVSRESYIPTSLAKARIPHLIYRGVLLGRQGKQLGKVWDNASLLHH